MSLNFEAPIRLLLPLLVACSSALSTQVPPPAELTVDIGVMHLGHASHIRVHDALPGETLYVVRANAITAGPCPAAMNGSCLDVGPSAYLLGSMTADLHGLAELELVPPTSLPEGAAVALQVVALRGGAAVVSEPVLRTLTSMGTRTMADLAVGDLAVTEILMDPVAVDDAVGEWFEVVNTTTETVDLDGLVIEDSGTDSFAVSGSVLVEAGGRVVFGASADRAINGGVFVDLPFTGLTLANGADALILSYAGVVIDEVAWDDGATFPDLSGAAIQTHVPESNEQGAFWCGAEAGFGAGDLGSPGLPNRDCPVLIDDDGDGYTADVDCDDSNARIYPGRSELCDGVDSDCDPTTGEDGLRSNTYIQDSTGRTIGWEIRVCPGTHDFDRVYQEDVAIIGVGNRDDILLTGNLRLQEYSPGGTPEVYTIDNVTMDGTIDSTGVDLTIRNSRVSGQINARYGGSLVVEDSEVSAPFSSWNCINVIEVTPYRITDSVISDGSVGVEVNASSGRIERSSIIDNNGGVEVNGYSDDASVTIYQSDLGSGSTDNSSFDIKVYSRGSLYVNEDNHGEDTSRSCYARPNSSSRRGYCQ